MMISSKKWNSKEGISLFSKKKQLLSVGDVISCKRFFYETPAGETPIADATFKAILIDTREKIELLYHYEEEFVSHDYGSSFTITAVKDFESEVLPSLKKYDVTFYNEVVRKSTGTLNEFTKAELDKLE